MKTGAHFKKKCRIAKNGRKKSKSYNLLAIHYFLFVALCLIWQLLHVRFKPGSMSFH